MFKNMITLIAGPGASAVVRDTARGGSHDRSSESVESGGTHFWNRDRGGIGRLSFCRNDFAGVPLHRSRCCRNSLDSGRRDSSSPGARRSETGCGGPLTQHFSRICRRLHLFELPSEPGTFQGYGPRARLRPAQRDRVLEILRNLPRPRVAPCGRRRRPLQPRVCHNQEFQRHVRRRA